MLTRLLTTFSEWYLFIWGLNLICLQNTVHVRFYICVLWLHSLTEQKMGLIKYSSRLNRAVSGPYSCLWVKRPSSSTPGNVGLCFAVKFLQPDLQIAPWINDRVFFSDKGREQGNRKGTRDIRPKCFGMKRLYYEQKTVSIKRNEEQGSYKLSARANSSNMRSLHRFNCLENRQISFRGI